MRIIYTIILNYNNYDDTIACIESLKKIQLSKDIQNHILLIDNNSTDDSFKKLKIKYKNKVLFLSSGFNFGYAFGNNVGIKYALDKRADYICILNNDTIAYEDFISPCINYLIEHNNIGFISPAIENIENDKIQSTGGDIIFNRGIVTVKNYGKVRKELPEIIQSDYIGGACLICRTSIFKEIGLIPENYFLFFEETEWCWKAKQHGLKNVCITSTYLKHKGSASIDSVSGLHTYLMERNRIVFLKRNAPTFLIFLLAFIYLLSRIFIKGLVENKEYFKYYKYYFDGIRNKIDTEKFPLIVIKDD